MRKTARLTGGCEVSHLSTFTFIVVKQSPVHAGANCILIDV